MCVTLTVYPTSKKAESGFRLGKRKAPLNEWLNLTDQNCSKYLSAICARLKIVLYGATLLDVVEEFIERGSEVVTDGAASGVGPYHQPSPA